MGSISMDANNSPFKTGAMYSGSKSGTCKLIMYRLLGFDSASARTVERLGTGTLFPRKSLIRVTFLLHNDRKIPPTPFLRFLREAIWIYPRSLVGAVPPWLPQQRVRGSHGGTAPTLNNSCKACYILSSLVKKSPDDRR